MAKKKATRKSQQVAKSLEEFLAAPYNPRTIDQEAKENLQSSLYVFGDMSGITINLATGNVIGGHQRKEQLSAMDVSRIKWAPGYYTIQLGFADSRFESVERDGWVDLPDGARFRVRGVNWRDRAFEKAANVTANNPHICGSYTDGLAAVLADIQADIPDVAIGSLGLDKLLSDLGAIGGDGDPDPGPGGSSEEVYQVIIEFTNEQDQKKLFKRLSKEGYRCRV